MFVHTKLSEGIWTLIWCQEGVAKKLNSLQKYQEEAKILQDASGLDLRKVIFSAHPTLNQWEYLCVG